MKGKHVKTAGSRAKREDLIVNGLRVPPTLVAAIIEGRWISLPADRRREIFDDDPVSRRFLDTVDHFKGLNRSRRDEVRPEYIGSPGNVLPPGDVDPRLLLPIGDFCRPVDRARVPGAPTDPAVHLGDRPAYRVSAGTRVT
ncbi:MAG: hypothetical protein J2P54_00055 [Bradyrhizobiaceae bacterium]|nr:hypothetical protein [Bradyrhizobiaceae bacterium]